MRHSIGAPRTTGKVVRRNYSTDGMDFEAKQRANLGNSGARRVVTKVRKSASSLRNLKSNLNLPNPAVYGGSIVTSSAVQVTHP